MAFFGFRVLQRYREASKARPLAVAFVTCYGKGTASDLVAQMLVERKSQPSVQRNVAFALFSGAYLGIGQHFVYNVAFTRIFGAGMDLRVGVQKVLADLFCHVPFMYLPLYYMFEDTALGVGNPQSGLQRWWKELPGTMAAYCKIFPMFHLFNFTVTPPELRLTVLRELLNSLRPKVLRRLKQLRFLELTATCQRSMGVNFFLERD